MSADESMIRFFGRCKIKQYVKDKPILWGIKLWSLCTISGYLLNFQIYCGKESEKNNEQLSSCNLGTRVVMNMLQHFLRTVSSDKRQQYRVTFDKFFTSPDLLVHLQILGLRATGTVRQNRVYEIKIVDKKEKRVPLAVELDKRSV